MPILDSSNKEIATDNDSLSKEKVIDALHHKQELPSLRTYQGDIAEIIKKQDESVASIVVKEKIREEEQPKVQHSNQVGVNITTLIVSLVLVAGSLFAILSIYNKFLKEGAPRSQSLVTNMSLIQADEVFTLRNATPQNIKDEIAKTEGSKGIVLIDVYDMNQRPVALSSDFLKLLSTEVPTDFVRNLKGEYAFGVIYEDPNKSSHFLIIKTSDFGIAFSGMLAWEENLASDFSFGTTSTSYIGYVWKDLIIKNKDMRVFTNEKDLDNPKIIYTFIDKDTILIVTSLGGLREIMAKYNSSPVVR